MTPFFTSGGMMLVFSPDYSFTKKGSRASFHSFLQLIQL